MISKLGNERGNEAGVPVFELAVHRLILRYRTGVPFLPPSFRLRVVEHRQVQESGHIFTALWLV
jgi:hypothetical protein